MSFFFSFFPISRILEHVSSDGSNPFIKKNYLLIEEKENEEEISFLTGKRNGIWNTDGRTDFL